MRHRGLARQGRRRSPRCRRYLKDFYAWFTPRLQFFLSQLEAHHHVEDQHYFPLLRAAERRLGRGFDVLETDHGVIHREIMESVEAANAVLGLIGGDADLLRRTGDRYADTSGRLVKRLVRHLGDEEDLIIPLILDRGEEKLGMST